MICRRRTSLRAGHLVDLCGRSSGQTEMLRPGQQMLDRRGVPSRSAARRAFAHGLELGGDLLQRAIGRCRLDAGDQPDQPVIALLRSGAVQQAGLDDAFVGQPPHRAAQPLDRPGRLPACPRFRTRTTSPQGWSGRIRRTVGSQESSCARTPSRCAASRLARTLRIASGSPARRPGLPPTRPRARGRVQAGFGALGDQRPLELGDGAQHLQREHALGRGGVDRIAQAAEMRARGLQLLDDGQQVADRAGQTIEPDHDQGFAGADLAQQARQHGPAAIGAGGMLLEDRGAAGRAQLVELRIGALFLGGDPCVADQTAWRRRFFGLLAASSRAASSEAAFYNSTRCLKRSFAEVAGAGAAVESAG